MYVTSLCPSSMKLSPFVVITACVNCGGAKFVKTSIPEMQTVVA